MSVSKRSSALVILSIAAIVAVVLALGWAARQQSVLEEQTTLATTYAERVADYQRLKSLDSLVFAGEYEAALNGYETVAVDSQLLGVDLSLRTDFVNKVIRTEYRLDTLLRRRPRITPRPAPALPINLAPAPIAQNNPSLNQPLRYDSLRFALQKAEMQVRNLTQKLSRTSGPNYLTFASREGNETYYVGEIKRGKANGNGVALLSTGSRYQGEWEDNHKHGVGEFHWNDGAWYEGEYEDDLRSGRGTYHFPDGSTFVGQWAEDVRNGEGVFYNAKGKVVTRGVWEGDVLVEGR